jgi:hypothetical protein
MRQLVSVVTDDSVRYFVQDGDNVQQIAQLLNPGLDVPAVIELGDVLTSALRLNGNRSPKSGRELPAAPEPAVRVEAAPSKRTKRVETRTRWGVSGFDVLDDVRAHPGTTVAEIVGRIYPEDVPKARGVCSAHVTALIERRSLRVIKAERQTDVGRREVRTLYAHDHVEQSSE